MMTAREMKNHEETQ